MKTLPLARVAHLMVLFWAAAFANGATTYTITDIGVLQGHQISFARAINDAGQVVGDSLSASTSVAFVWKTGSIQPLPLPTGVAAGTPSFATAINANGQVVGATGSPGSRATLWSNGAATDLTTLAGGQNFFSATGINSSGTIVGSSQAATERAVFASAGTVTPLNDLPGASFSRALAINNAGQIVGQSGPRPVVWNGLTPTDLGVGGSARAINDTGGIAGVQTGTAFQAVLWQASQPSLLPNPAGFAGAIGNGINDANVVVGHGGPTGFHPVLNMDQHRAVIWLDGLGHDLNGLVQNSTGWTLLEAWDVNNRGEIVGVGQMDGDLRGFMLSPIPEPSTYALMLAGMALLGFAARRRNKLPN